MRKRKPGGSIAIQMEGVSKNFGENHAVRDLSIEVHDDSCSHRNGRICRNGCLVEICRTQVR